MLRAWLVEPDTVPHRTICSVRRAIAVRQPSTAGAAEDMLVAYRNAGRGPIIGQTSAGSPGQVGEFRLFKAWRLRLTVTRDAFPDGTEIQGAGIAPELPVAARVVDFLAGQDRTLERARAHVRREQARRSP
jgi:C-terminal processing protease CtpA/Prc